MKNHVKLSHVVMWLCQIPSRFCFYVRNRRLLRVCLILVLVFLYCEFIHYYVVLLWCTWPKVQRSGSLLEPGTPVQPPLRAMFIGDTHILGSNAHWFDKLRREWQMVQSFQASMLIHSPDIVFILVYRCAITAVEFTGYSADPDETAPAGAVSSGSSLFTGDLLDTGQDSTAAEFRYHVDRFKKMFQTPLTTRTEILVGNHDVGFHYKMTERKHNMFVDGFKSPAVRLLQIRDSIFVLINSMAMEGDSCNICREAKDKLRDIKWKLKCAKGQSEKRLVAEVCDNMDTMSFTRPIILQHFPMYRESDINCSTPDAPPEEEKQVLFRPKMDCLSKESSSMILDWLDPRLIISAHTHHGCYRVHENGAPEYTVASYNWRNKPGPTFLLAEITGERYAVNRCFLPNEITVFCMYGIGAIAIVIVLLMPMNKKKALSGLVQEVANKFN